MSDERVDATIDEVAREMTRGELPPDFRAGVIARLERGDERHLTWRPALVLSTLAVAAVVLVAVLVGRLPWRSDGRVAQADREQVTQQAAPKADPIDATKTSGPPATVRLTPDTRNAARRTPDATFEAVVASDLAPAPIQIESIDVEAMESMDVAPLSVDAMESIDVPELDVAPLEVPAIGE
jgi:hypothetical protein